MAPFSERIQILKPAAQRKRSRRRLRRRRLLRGRRRGSDQAVDLALAEWSSRFGLSLTSCTWFRSRLWREREMLETD